MKNILVTGAAGFIGTNLIEHLRRNPEYTVLPFDVNNTEDALTDLLKAADVVFHLAGLDGPASDDEYIAVNTNVTMRIVARLIEREVKPMIVLASSVQAAAEHAYGRSKRRAEAALEEYGAIGGGAVIVRLPEVFGKWSRPKYNSLVATMCERIVRGDTAPVDDPETVAELVYIDDVVASFIGLIDTAGEIGVRRIGVHGVTAITHAALERELVRLHAIRTAHALPDMSDAFRRALYATLLSFLPENDFTYGLLKQDDAEGTLAEFIRSPGLGQILVARTRPGHMRCNHYHDTKIEKLCVLEGDAVVRFRHIANGAVLSYRVSGTDFRIVDVPPGYTHSMENAGERDLVVMVWASEVDASTAPDTYPLAVQA